jgi:hypothetical protein
VLELYDLRREEVMRTSRAAIAAWLPRSYEDVRAIVRPDHPHNAAWRQVSSYFEMAFGFARHGAVHAELLAENTGEGLFLFAKIEPWLEDFRREYSPLAFRNAEWVARNTEAGAQRLALFQKRVATMLAKT